jgi:alpha-2-macroglobulin
VIAVAANGNDRFGGSSTVVEIRQPFMVQPALPRFVAIGDRFEAGVVLQNQTGKPGKVALTLEMPTDSPVSLEGPATQTLTLPVGPTEVRFLLRAKRLGSWDAQFKAVLTGAGTGRDETDAVQVSVPVLLTHRLETVAAAGQVIASTSGAQEVEQIVPPLGVVPDQGGLEINTASSALVGLQNGVDYLVEYPYGCLEQRSSRLRALVMLNDLRDQFPLPSLAGEKFKQSITAEMSRIRNYLTPEGGLGYWEGNNYSDVYLSARVLLLLLDARDLGLEVPNDVITQVTGYLSSIVQNVKSQSLRRPLQDADGVWPNRAHVLYALARAGVPDTELMAKLWTRRAELPILEQLHLVNAMVLGGMKGIRANKLYGELLSSVRVEADQAFLQDETSRDAWDRFVCPCSAYLSAGNTHNTAELLSLLVKADPTNPLAPQMARWLMAQRDSQGRWGNTLENGYALTALVNYYRAAEPTAPNFKAEVLLGTTNAFEKVFSGRSLAAQSTQVPMNKLSPALNAQPDGAAPASVPLTVRATGSGTLFWNARLRYEPATKNLKALDSGFRVERDYLPYAGTGSKTLNGVSTFAAGDLVRVSLKIRTEQNRRNAVIDDPIPAGLEPLDARLSSTSQTEVSGGERVANGSAFGIDHVEIQDNRVLLFATGLAPGTFTYTYVARATAPGTFIAAPTQAEEMYRPEIFGRTATATVVITPPSS